MAKRVDPLKAKAAKQRKIAIGGAVILLALLGIQGPKTLKMLQGPQPVAEPTAAAPVTTTPAPSATTPAGTPAGEVPVAAAPELTAVADSDLAPVAEEGQLATFERFASKDPFAQQASAPAQAQAPAADPTDGTETATAPAETTSDDRPAVDSAAGDPAANAGFTTGAGSAPDPPELAAATSIAVNGVAEDVAIDGVFPRDEPTFVLVKLGKNGKSVEIGIAGGEYASGGETMTLTFGKPITLQNTADGSRYELELRAIQGRPLPKQK